MVVFFGLFTTSSEKICNFDEANVILFQIKALGRRLKEATLARHFIKVSFTPQFFVIRNYQVYQQSSLIIKKENVLIQLQKSIEFGVLLKLRAIYYKPTRSKITFHYRIRNLLKSLFLFYVFTSGKPKIKYNSATNFDRIIITIISTEKLQVLLYFVFSLVT